MFDNSPLNKCKKRIYGHGRGWSFTRKDLADLGPATAIDWAIYHLEKEGIIRKIARGLYDFPKKSSFFDGFQSPDLTGVAFAIARKHGWNITVSGETALNVIGMSTQVPGKYVFHSDGPNKKYTIDGMIVEFRRVAPSKINLNNDKAVLIVQALQALGKHSLSDTTYRALKKYIEPKDCHAIIKSTQYTPTWMFDVIKRTCAEVLDGQHRSS